MGRLNSISKGIFFALAVGVAAYSPYGARYIAKAAAKELSKKLEEKGWLEEKIVIVQGEVDREERIRDSLHRLRAAQYIKITPLSRGEYQIGLTKKGQKRFQKLVVEDLKVPRPGRWDGKWRIIVFDVPEKYKGGREALREKLKDLGFFRVQDSTWVYPYSCEDEIDLVCEFFSVKRYVLRWVVTLENDLQLRKYFKLI